MQDTACLELVHGDDPERCFGEGGGRGGSCLGTPVRITDFKIKKKKKTEGRRRMERQRMRWLNGIINSMDISLNKFRKIVKDREAWHAAVHVVSRSQTRLSD